jgi:DNA polymerase III delta prime subunit
MKFGINQYEFRYLNAAEWQDISEIDLMQRLYEFYDRIVPSIQKMIQGEQVMTQYAIYRLKCPEQKLSLQ